MPTHIVNSESETNTRKRRKDNYKSKAMILNHVVHARKVILNMLSCRD